MLRGYVRFLADSVRLRDWQFRLVVDHHDGDDLCRIFNTDGRRVGEITIFPAFFDADGGEAAATRWSTS